MICRQACGTEPGVLQVLGGRVEALADAWEFQRSFGAAERPAEPAAAGADAQRAPRFTHFIPGRTRAPSIYMQGQGTPYAAQFCSEGLQLRIIVDTALLQQIEVLLCQVGDFHCHLR